MKFEVSKKQAQFISAPAFEVLFGGEAGGGKSYAQILDAMGFAAQYPCSAQLILRRTIPEIERTLLRIFQHIVPAGWYRYVAAKRTVIFENGSRIEFGYCRNKNDVYRYQSAEYDVIRFDELTHFSQHDYLYLITRLRGANGFPKQMKSTTNPGGPGHHWVKERFVDIGAPGIAVAFSGGDRLFLTSHMADNYFLMRADSGYRTRLTENLESEGERLALAFGDWNIAGGRFFSEFSPKTHVVRPFEIPRHWQRFFVIDYGLDMTAGYWIALDAQQRAYVYRELYQPNMIISQAAERIQDLCGEPLDGMIAPPDLWSRRQDSGRSAAEIFLEQGLVLTKAPADRIAGWLELKEWLKPVVTEQGNKAARLVLFDTCIHAIRCLGAILQDRNDGRDCARDPHELTHAPDALRYFAASRPGAAVSMTEDGESDQLYNLMSYGQKGTREWR